jgi:hypothetical protein
MKQMRDLEAARRAAEEGDGAAEPVHE